MRKSGAVLIALLFMLMVVSRLQAKICDGITENLLLDRCKINSSVNWEKESGSSDIMLKLALKVYRMRNGKNKYLKSFEFANFFGKMNYFIMIQDENFELSKRNLKFQLK